MTKKIEPQQPATKLLTDREVAEMFSVSAATIWRYARSGLLPQPIRFGRVSRWKLSVIEAAIAGWEAEKTPPGPRPHDRKAHFEAIAAKAAAADAA